MAANTPALRAMLQARSHRAPPRDSLALSDISDSPSLYSIARTDAAPSPVPSADQSSIYSASHALARVLGRHQAVDDDDNASDSDHDEPEHDRKPSGGSVWFDDDDSSRPSLSAEPDSPAPASPDASTLGAPSRQSRLDFYLARSSPFLPPPMDATPHLSPALSFGLPSANANANSPTISEPDAAEQRRLSTLPSRMGSMHMGPKMTFLSPAPWEDEDGEEALADSDGEDERRSEDVERYGRRARKMSENSKSSGGRSRSRTVGGARDRELLKGLGLSSGAAKASTTTIATTSSTSSLGGNPLPASRSKSRSRPASPIASHPAHEKALPPLAAGRSPRPQSNKLGHKFSLPRLRGAFSQSGSFSSSATATPLPRPAPLALPSPSTASFTSSQPSPSPLETDFPRTPTSTSTPSLHPYANANASPSSRSTGTKSNNASPRDPRSGATAPQAGGQGISLISLEAAQERGRSRSTNTKHGPGIGVSKPGGTPNDHRQVKPKRSGFLRIFSGAPSTTHAANAASHHVSSLRESNFVRDIDVPPVPALPAAFAHTAPSSPARNINPDSTTPAKSAPPLRERRNKPPPPKLEVSVKVSHADDPGSGEMNIWKAVPHTAPLQPARPFPAAPGPPPSMPRDDSLAAEKESSHENLDLDLDLLMPRTPRTPIPTPLQLRPVSTAFSASFAELLSDALPSPHLPDRPPLQPRSSSTFTSSSSRSSPRSPRSPPSLRPRTSSHSHPHPLPSPSADEITASLQAQIAHSRTTYRAQVSELENQVGVLRAEVRGLETRLAARDREAEEGEGVCERCGEWRRKRRE